MLTFHAAGDWTREQVHLAQAQPMRRIVPEVEDLIEQAWQQATSQPGVNLFDGPMCRLESWSAAPERLSLALSETSYKAFLGTNLHHPELADRYGREILANPFGVSPALQTADGWLMMGRRNGSVAYYPNRIHPFAGAVEPRDALNVFDAVMRELKEELGFTSDDVADVRCTGIAEDRSIRQPELIFRVLSTRTKAEIEAGVDRTEHHASWSIPATAEALDEALKDTSPMTPVGVAALLLWGRGSFGVEWFEERMHQAIERSPGSRG
jgi:8-oxo-dGTP pyrophosphatase MutT (NUDIX family)